MAAALPFPAAGARAARISANARSLSCCPGASNPNRSSRSLSAPSAFRLAPFAFRSAPIRKPLHPGCGELYKSGEQLGAELLPGINEREGSYQPRLQGHRHQRAQLALLRHRRARNDGDAKAGFDDALDRLRAAELHHDIEVFGRDVAASQVLVHELAGTGAELAANVRLARELLRFDGCGLGEPVPRRADQHQLVFAADLGLETG